MSSSSGDLSETDEDILKAAVVESFVMLVEEWKVCNQMLGSGLEAEDHLKDASLFMRDGGVISVVKGKGKKKQEAVDDVMERVRRPLTMLESHMDRIRVWREQLRERMLDIVRISRGRVQSYWKPEVKELYAWCARGGRDEGEGEEVAVVAPVGNFCAGVGEDEVEEEVVEVEEVEELGERGQPPKRRKRESAFEGEGSRFEVGEGSGRGRGGEEEEAVPRLQRRPPVVRRTPGVERGGVGEDDGGVGRAHSLGVEGVGCEIPSAILGCGILYLRIIKSTKIFSLHKCNHQHRDNTHTYIAQTQVKKWNAPI